MPVLRHCAWCAKPFQVPNWQHKDRPQRYCSHVCRAAAREYREPSPDVWDGQTRYNHEPQLQDYTLSCFLCGRGETLKLTDFDAKNLGQRNCPHCGGRVLLALDAGQITESSGRVSKAVRERYAGLADSHL